MKARYWRDEAANTIYVRFVLEPTLETRDALKACGFRYNSRARRWSAPNSWETGSAAYQAISAENERHSGSSSRESQIASAPQRRRPQGGKPAESGEALSARDVQQVAAASQMTEESLGGVRHADFAWIPSEKQPNEQQWHVIKNTEGPMLVIAGPGTGKTATVVNRVVHLVADKAVDPSEIMVVTYTVKAARELVSRIAAAFSKLDAPTNLDQMRVGTFHALCLEILREYARSAEMKNARVVESFDELTRICEDWSGFKDLEKSHVFKRTNRKGEIWYPRGYRLAGDFSAVYAAAVEEGIEPQTLTNQEENADLAAFGSFLEGYMNSKARGGVLSFADIQAKTLRLLEERPDVLDDLHRKIRYIIVDEYQDANSIQEELVLKLAGGVQNVCVVGDDDQSLYRFRGANVEGILRFPSRFEHCDQDNMLRVNYRSQEGIVEFYNRWMQETHFGPSEDEQFDWGRARVEKAIVASRGRKQGEANQVSVAKCAGDGASDWCSKILELIRSIQAAPSFKDLNQIAFICSAFKNDNIQYLIGYLEDNGVPVYAPRAGKLGERDEIKLAIGCIIKCFERAKYRVDISKKSGTGKWYSDCKKYAGEKLVDYPELSSWVESKARQFEAGKAPRGERALLNLFCQMLQFKPFHALVDAGGSVSLADTMPARNLARFAELIDSFEARMEELDEKGWGNRVDFLAKRFFDGYFADLRQLSELDEAEDAEEYAPSGYVSFITAHQSKGLEFPVVIACSLFEEPRPYERSLLDDIREFGREEADPIELPEKRNLYDFWRKYYTVFSRAQDLLVLTGMTDGASGNESGDDPSKCFQKLYGELPSVDELDFSKLHISGVEPSRIMRTYAFTSDVSAYQRCPRQYRLRKIIGFPSGSTQAERFGDWVHQSIEEIHRRVLEDDSYTPSDDEVLEIVSLTRAAIEEGGARLEARVDDAYRQVKSYLANNEELWRNVREAEVELSVPRIIEGSERGGYILKGQIDLVTGRGEEVEILDFKSGRKPGRDSAIMRKYQKQLNVYAYLLRQKGYDVSRASLFFTGVDSAQGNMVSVSVSTENVKSAIAEFDEAAAKIEGCDFTAAASDEKDCRECVFRAYCGKTK